MSKHISVIARLNQIRGTFDLTIKHQSHFTVEFGGAGCSSDKINDLHCFIHCGVALTSYGTTNFIAHINQEWKFTTAVDIQISLLHSNDAEPRTVVAIPAQYWPRIKAAIEAYNEYFKDK